MIIPNQKFVVGEPVKERRKCIYCGGTVQDGSTKFISVAHAIPEAIGNTKFIQREECDTCNDFFSVNAEEDLCNLLVWKRLQYGLKGSDGYPTFQFTGGRYAKFFDFENIDYNSNWGHFESIKTDVKEKRVKGPVIISSSSPSDNVNICLVKAYIPQHIYKALVKCVIGLIGNNNLEFFTKTIDWLRYRESHIDLPMVAICECKKLVLEPELYIFTRKNEVDYKYPYCFAELRILDIMFVFIIPFAEKDKQNFVDGTEFAYFEEILKFQYGKYKLVNFSCITPQKIEEKNFTIKETKF